jgi:hypothetical protein
MWLATITGPNRHSGGITGAYMRAEQVRPGTSKIGIVLSMPGFLIARMGEKRLRAGTAD